MLPTFLVIGAAKAGTSSLSSYLRGHPEVYMTEPKEPHFFSRGWPRGVAHYEAFFENSAEQRARGEASTSYTQAYRYPDVPGRIASVLPDVRLVYLIRNPVDRIRSQYVHYVDRGREALPLARAVLENPEYVDGSSYGHQLTLYLEHFTREQLLVISTDQLREHRTETMKRVFDFIDVDPQAPTRSMDRELNRSADKRRAPAVVDAGRRALRRSGLTRSVPRGALTRVHRLLSRPVPAETTRVSPELETQLWARLDDDLARLRRVVGPDFDLWGRA